MPAAELWQLWKWLSSRKPPRRVPSRQRRILVEPLESRRLLATLEETFLPDSAGPQESAQFGYRVAASTSRVAVSAPLATVNAKQRGEVYLLDLQGNLLQRHSPADLVPQASIGSALALDDTYLLIGNDRNGVAAGGATLINAGTGAIVQTYKNPSPEAGDRFGSSVSISGNLMAVGAPGVALGSAGRVFLFNPTTFLTMRIISNPHAASGDAFGAAVALVGNKLLIGTPKDDNGAVDAGRAYLYDASNGALLHTFDNPSAEAGDLFGGSVAMYGNLAVIGAAGDDQAGTDAGQVYVYDVTTGQLLRTISAPVTAAGDQFGASVSLFNDNVVVGVPGSDAGGNANTGRAVIMSATTGGLIATISNPIAAANDEFGTAVAISSAGVVVGAPLTDLQLTDTGLAHVFDAATGALSRTLANPTPAVNDRFGAAVRIAGDYFISGMPGDDTYFRDSGKVRAYSVATGAFVREFFAPTPSLQANFGTALATSGNLLAVGASSEASGGAVHIFDFTTGNHVRTIINPLPANGDLFGAELDWDGNTLIIGAPGDDTQSADNGAVYSYDSTTGNLVRTFGNPSAAEGDRFGFAVAISGNQLAVGAPYNDTSFTDSGQAYLFNVGTGDVVQTLLNPTPTAGDLFGFALDLQGDRLLVGAPLDDGSVTNGGRAYAYHGVTGAFQAIVAPSFSSTQGKFGSAISISGNRVLIGDNPATSPFLGHVQLYNLGSLSILESFSLPTGSANSGEVDVFLSGTLFTVAETDADTVNLLQGVGYLYSRTTMTATFSAGNLTIGTTSSSDNVDNTMRVVRDGTDLLIIDSDEVFVAAPAGGSLENSGHTVRIPWSSVTGSLTVNLGAGADLLIVDLTAGNLLPAGGLSVSGGNVPNTLSIVGGDQGDVVYTNSSVVAGTMQMPGYGTLNYSSFSLLRNSGHATSATINLGPGTTTLADDGVSGNGLSQLSNASMVTMQFASPSGQMIINPAGNANTINFNPLPDLTSSLVLGSDTDRLNTLNFSGSNAFATDRSLTAYATGTITHNVGSSLLMSGTGNLSLTTSRAINNFGVRTATVDGNLLLSANQQEVSASGSGASIYLHTGTIIESTGSGKVSLLGRGRTSASDGNIGVYLYGSGTRLSAAAGLLTVVGEGNGSNLSANNHGVLVEAGAMIRGGAGGVTVDGTGGTTSTTTGSNHGVFVRDSSSQITSSNNGNVLVRGTGGLAATSFSAGVYAFGLATISAGGTGTVTVEGHGSTLSTATASGHRGVVVDSGTITSSGGAITVSGWGGGTGSASGGNYGVYVRNSNDAGPGRILGTSNAAITVDGTGGNVGAQSGNNNIGVFLTEIGSGVWGANGKVTVTGTGGGSAASTGNTGLSITNAAKVTATADAFLIGDGGGGTSSHGIEVHTLGALVSSASNLDMTGTVVPAVENFGIDVRSTGTITGNANFVDLRADALRLEGTNSVQFPVASAVRLRIVTAGFPIHLGSADLPGTALGLSSSDLNSISAPLLHIGGVAAGDIIVAEPVTRTLAGRVTLFPGLDRDIILGTAPLQIPVGSQLDFVTIGGQVTVADQAGSSISGALKLSAATEFRVRVASPSLFDHLSVTGQVELAGTLNLTPLNGYLPFTAGKLVVVQNDGTDPIVGVFSAGDGSPLPIGTDLNEGAVFSNNLFGTGMAATISYVGGDGNDVELTLSPAREIPTARIVDNRLLVTGTTRDDIILVNPVNNQVRVRVGNRVLGLFDNVTGISVDGLQGDDFVYVAPFLPATIITQETDPVVASHDLIFAGDNTNIAPAADPAAGEQQSVRDAILIQLLVEWTAEYNQLFPGGSQNPTVRRR